MNPLETFLGGFLLGVVATLILVWRRPRRAESLPPQGNGSQPHTDEQSASNIGHERGIEVFDD